MYYSLRADIYAEDGITDEPASLENISFLTGQPILEPIDGLLDFVVNNTKASPPRHLLGSIVPVFSQALIAVLERAGTDNLQRYGAVLRNSSGDAWSGYSAVNVIGLVDCAVMDQCEYNVIDNGPAGIPLVSFKKLVIDPARAMGLPLLRVAQEPSRLLIHDSLVSALKASKPSDGWGINIVPVLEIPPA